MIRVVALIFLISTQSFATEALDWAKQYMEHGCGNNISAAKSKAKQAAKKVGSQLEDDCDDDEGEFSLKISDGYCLEDTGNIACRTECTAIGLATCKF